MASARLTPWCLIALALGCGGGRGAGASRCAGTGDCPAGKACVDGVCADPPATPDGGPDGSLPDGAPRDATHADAGPLGCSGDLRSVLSPGGAVLAACPEGQGCLDGECVPVCAAAAGSGNNTACEFFLPTPPGYPAALPACFAAFVANPWDGPAHLEVDRGAVRLDVTRFGRLVDNTRPASEWAPVADGGLPPGQVAVLFLSSDPAAVMPETGVPLSCPVTPAVDASTALDGSGRSVAFHIRSDVPVTTYDILPYGGALSFVPGAELVLPASVWGRSHVVLGTMPGTNVPGGPLFLQVVGLEDGTRVELAPVVDLPSGPGLAGAPAGTTTSVTLGRGEVAQWELPPGPGDLTGSLLQSDRPVGVFTGSRFLRLQESPGPGGDATHQELPPVAALGHEYVAAPYETRRADLAPEQVRYRLVVAFDGTELSYEPPVPGASTHLDQGEHTDFRSAVPFRAGSQDAAHPFALAQVMDSANLPGGSRPGATTPVSVPEMRLGDEELVELMPPAQFQTGYVFFTDPSYATTNLVVVRQAGAGGFSPVRVDCLGELTGFTPVGAGSLYEWATVDLVRADVGTGPCANGLHTASSSAPFGLMVWGLDTYASYAFPAGGNADSLADLPVLF